MNVVPKLISFSFIDTTNKIVYKEMISLENGTRWCGYRVDMWHRVYNLTLPSYEELHARLSSYSACYRKEVIKYRNGVSITRQNDIFNDNGKYNQLNFKCYK